MIPICYAAHWSPLCVHSRDGAQTDDRAAWKSRRAPQGGMLPVAIGSHLCLGSVCGGGLRAIFRAAVGSDWARRRLETQPAVRRGPPASFDSAARCDGCPAVRFAGGLAAVPIGGTESSFVSLSSLADSETIRSQVWSVSFVAGAGGVLASLRGRIGSKRGAKRAVGAIFRARGCCGIDFSRRDASAGDRGWGTVCERQAG